MPLVKVFDWYYKVISRLKEKRNESIKCQSENYLIKIYFIAFTLIISTFGLISFGGIEIIRGNHPIFKEVPDGAICNDGWRSHSQGSGTCSWHDGVDYYLYKDVEVGFYYANPTPYFSFGIFFLILGFVLIYRNKTLELTVLEVLLSFSRWIYFVFVFALSSPLFLLRTGIHIALFIPWIFFLFFRGK